MGKSNAPGVAPATGTRQQHTKGNAQGKGAQPNQQALSRGRNNSGSGKGQPQNVKGNQGPKGQAAVPASNSNVPNKYPKPGGRSFGGPTQVDVLTPTVPPLYPTAPKPSPLCPDVMERVAVYKRLCQYLSNNYGVIAPKRKKCAFSVDRYTDRYNASLAVNPDVIHRISKTRLPEELTTVRLGVKRIRKPKSRIVKQETLEDLPDDDDQKDPTAEPSAKKSRDDEPEGGQAVAEIIEEDEMDDADEELDMGTDYVSNYFDNGEEFLDSDNDGDDDGPVY